MTFVIPLAVAAALTVFGLMAGKKSGDASTPALPPGTPPKPGAVPAPTAGKELSPAPQPGILPSTGATSGAVSVSPSGTVDDAFDALVAAALAKGDVAALEALAKQAEARGLLDIARSIRDEEARITMGAPKSTAPGPSAPVVAPVSQPTGRAVLSMAAGSRGADVIEWQKYLTDSGWPVGTDGVFGKDADNRTRQWQKANGLTVDGIVGPASWKFAYAHKPALAVTPRPDVVVTTAGKVIPAASVPPPVAAPTPMPQTQSLPESTPQVTTESDARLAARELTAYLTSGGGLAFRWKESRPKVSAWLARMGIPDPKGLYGRDSARAVMQQGFVPVTPYYWPSTGAAQAKKEFLSLVSTYSAADPQRASQWAKLVSDVNRA